MEFNNKSFYGDSYLEDEIFKIKNKFKIKTFIEIGDFKGNTAEWLSNNFQIVHLIGCSSRSYFKTQKNIQFKTNIKFYNGNRARLLKKRLNDLDDNIIVFFDERCNTGSLIRELDSIRKAKKIPVIIIYNFKIPDKPNPWYDFYPGQNIVYGWPEIKNKVIEIYGEDNYEYYYNNQQFSTEKDSVFIIPKGV